MEWVLYVLAVVLFMLYNSGSEKTTADFNAVVGMFLIVMSYTFIQIKDSIDKLR